MCSNYDTVSRTERLHRYFGVALPQWPGREREREQEKGREQEQEQENGQEQGGDWAQTPSLAFNAPAQPESPAGGLDDAGGRPIWPMHEAVFIRRRPARDGAQEQGALREAHAGRFGLIPHWAGALDFGRRTYNARAETVAEKPSFRDSWRSGQRCIVPVEHIYEPNWSSGRAVPMRIGRNDDAPMGIAGLWACNRKATGAAVFSFTMLTVNADTHALFRTVHRPTDEKRMVVILPEQDYDAWLDAPPARAIDFLRQYPAELLMATADPARGRRLA